MIEYKKISGLTAATALDGTELFEGVQGSASTKVTGDQIATLVRTQSPTAKTADYTITDDDVNVFEVTPGSADVTMILPTLGDNGGRRILIFMLGTATGKTIVDGEGGETIDGETTIDLDSQHDFAEVFAGTSQWTLLQYKDHGDDGTHGWLRRVDGSMEQWNLTYYALSTVSSVSHYITPAQSTTLPKSFASTAYSVMFNGALGQDVGWIGWASEYPEESNKTANTFQWRAASPASQDIQGYYRAFGRWRT